MSSDIMNKIQRADQAAKSERLQSPQMIQKTKAVRYPSGSPHLATCQEDAQNDDKISVRLLDKNGVEIGDAFDVTFLIAQGGEALNTTTTLLEAGDPIICQLINGTWYCVGLPLMPFVIHVL